MIRGCRFSGSGLRGGWRQWCIGGFGLGDGIGGVGPIGGKSW